MHYLVTSNKRGILVLSGVPSMRNDYLAYMWLSKPMMMLLTKQSCPFLSTMSMFLINFPAVGQ